MKLLQGISDIIKELDIWYIHNDKPYRGTILSVKFNGRVEVSRLGAEGYLEKTCLISEIFPTKADCIAFIREEEDRRHQKEKDRINNLDTPA